MKSATHCEIPPHVFLRRDACVSEKSGRAHNQSEGSSLRKRMLRDRLDKVECTPPIPPAQLTCVITSCNHDSVRRDRGDIYLNQWKKIFQQQTEQPFDVRSALHPRMEKV
jgi:hypothetical protein